MSNAFFWRPRETLRKCSHPTGFGSLLCALEGEWHALYWLHAIITTYAYAYAALFDDNEDDEILLR